MTFEHFQSKIEFTTKTALPEFFLRFIFTSNFLFVTKLEESMYYSVLLEKKTC